MKVDVSKGIEIGCHHYKIECSAEVNKDLDSRQRFGEHHTVGRKLQISTSYGSEQFEATFIHELIESVNEVNTYCHLKHDDIQNLGEGIAQALKSLGIKFTYGEVK